MSFEYSQEISNDYEKLFENKKGYDVIIYAGENENLKEIHAHSLILRTRSQYFNTTFCNNLVKKENGKFIFKKPNISSNLFEIILRFIYCGKIDLKNLQGPEMLKLSMVADELNVPTLIFCIQKKSYGYFSNILSK
uniref:BTB domain-containing protein n=1 Tax=Rhizophagus irregularis (strain DAOM 181602 / DAOM 197198 / MUCL 43194) TaxID=747089 RepID=U9TCS0_RHIID